MSVEKILKKVRPSLLKLQGYKSARSLYQGQDMVYLDANEIAADPYIGAPSMNRYIPQQPKAMIDKFCRLYDVSSQQIIVSRGADEAIDILIRTFCTPDRDNIVICPPTFPMYAQSAQVNSIEIREAMLNDDFSLNLKAIKKARNKRTKILFICSPNNPTANLLDREDIITLLEKYPDTIIAVDETYIEFTQSNGLLSKLGAYPNLVLFRTLSKSFASAGLRCGVAMGHADIIGLAKKVLAPYPIPAPVAAEVIKILDDKNQERMKQIRKNVLETKEKFVTSLNKIDGIQNIYPSDTNFILVKVDDANEFYQQCLDGGFIVRDQSTYPGLDNCIRISIGSPDQMDDLLKVIKGETKERKKQRTASVKRKTNETAISVDVNLDEAAPISITTGVGFYDHMLEQIAKHAGFSLVMECDGDLHIDPHHTIEDCAIALGQALKEALGDKRGIGRYGFSLPMDEANATALIDLSGRFYLKFNADFHENMVGDLPTDMIEHIFRSLAENMNMTLHIKAEGENTHHIVEGCFKAFARALGQAIRWEGSDILPSTKGML